MKNKALFILPPTRFNEVELNAPKNILTKAGIDVTISSTVTGEITGDYEGQTVATVLFNEEDIATYDLVAVIGGTGTIDFLWGHQPLTDYLLEAHKKGVYVTGICAGSVTLAEAGLLSARQGTCYPIDLMINKLKEHGVEYLEQNVVSHKDIITSNGPDGAEDFGKALLALYA